MAKLEIKPHQVILFQGDSITDAGRSRRAVGPNHPQGMGDGYPTLIADRLLEKYPDRHLQIYNRGISGDRIQDLAHRWTNDSLRLLPDIISLLVGVNDTWNYLYLGMGSDPGEYREIFRKILSDTRQQLPEIQYVLCEPFVLLTGEVSEEWLADISERQEIVRILADEFKGIFVPFQAALNQAAEEVPPRQLLDDGVHPTNLGHRILADCWIETVLD